MYAACSDYVVFLVLGDKFNDSAPGKHTCDVIMDDDVSFSFWC